MNRRAGALLAAIGPFFLLLFALWRLSTQAAALDQSAPAAQLAPAQNLDLVLTATVGLDPNVCATTTGLRVLPGATVYYCYTAANTGAVTLTTHTLLDTRAGVIWDRKSLVLAPGAVTNTVAAGQPLGAIAGISATTFVTWTAQIGTNGVVTATGNTRVEVVTPRLTLTKTVGLDPATCSTTVTQTVLPQADAYYCLTVRNTGDITFTQHRLADPLLGLARDFNYTLPPGGQLLLTDASHDPLGADVDLSVRTVTRTLTNTVFYTATTLSGYTAGGVATVTRAATSTVSLAKATVAFSKTLSTSDAECSTTDVLTVPTAASFFYYCARVRNTGAITLTHHLLNEPKLGLSLNFTYTLAPGQAFTLTNASMSAVYSLPVIFGPFTVSYGGDPLALDTTMFYTGTGLFTSTVTASAHAFAGVNATPTATLTPSPTTTGSSSNDDDDDNPTDTPTVTFTPSVTPIPPTATPTFTPTFTPETPSPTPTRSYAISVLATPTPRFVSPLALPVDQAATLAALDTAAAYEATLAAAQLASTLPAPSPLETPTPTVTPMPALTVTLTSALSPTAAMVLIVVTDTPDPQDTPAPPTTPLGPNGQRPITLPPPPPTPDYLLLAAQALDGMALAAGWIWFILGSLVFFTVAGVLAGLAFRQQERRRFELHGPALPPAHNQTELPPIAPDDDWPASLP